MPHLRLRLQPGRDASCQRHERNWGERKSRNKSKGEFSGLGEAGKLHREAAKTNEGGGLFNYKLVGKVNATVSLAGEETSEWKVGADFAT